MNNEQMHAQLIRLTANAADNALLDLSPQVRVALRVNVAAMAALLYRLDDQAPNVIAFPR